MSSEGRPYNDKPHMLHTLFSSQIENANEISLIVIYVINLEIISSNTSIEIIIRSIRHVLMYCIALLISKMVDTITRIIDVMIVS